MKQLGDILVETEIISKRTLERALERQVGCRKRLGAVLEDMGVITEIELAEALARQFNFKIIRSFAERDFAPELLGLIPSDFAVKKLIFPLKQTENVLAVATTDPFDLEVNEMLTRMTGFHIIPVISTRKDIREAIRKSYLKGVNIIQENVSTVLVVENSAPIAAVIQTALSRDGFNVIFAQDGLQGLKFAEKERPHVILTDSSMPRMDGYAFQRAIKTNPMTAHIPVIMMSENATSENEQLALESGFIDFIPKPLQPVRVVSRVRHVLELTKRFQL